MSEPSTEDAAFKIHKIRCPEDDCGAEFYTKVPEEGVPSENEVDCVECDTKLKLNYLTSEEEDVLFEVGVNA